MGRNSHGRTARESSSVFDAPLFACANAAAEQIVSPASASTAAHRDQARAHINRLRVRITELSFRLVILPAPGFRFLLCSSGLTIKDSACFEYELRAERSLFFGTHSAGIPPVTLPLRARPSAGEYSAIRSRYLFAVVRASSPKSRGNRATNCYPFDSRSRRNVP